MRVRLAVMSDTHCRHREITNVPQADILIHCGDFTNMGREDEVLDFADWLASLPHRHKIVVPGNHDACLDAQRPLLYSQRAFDRLSSVSRVLINESVEVEGIKFYGSPNVWGAKVFSITNDAEAYEVFGSIPDDTDILLTHSPPLGVMDLSFTGERIGCDALLVNVVDRVQPAVHFFGHAHGDWGVRRMYGVYFVNASSVNMSGLNAEPVRLVEMHKKEEGTGN